MILVTPMPIVDQSEKGAMLEPSESSNLWAGSIDIQRRGRVFLPFGLLLDQREELVDHGL